MKNYTAKLEKLCRDKRVYLHADLTLEKLAKMLGTNRTYISVTLHDVMGTSFYGYINPMRAAYAAELIRNGNHSVKDVMARSGFNSFNSFRRAFYEKYGCTPGEYVKALSSGEKPEETEG